MDKRVSLDIGSTGLVALVATALLASASAARAQITTPAYTPPTVTTPTYTPPTVTGPTYTPPTVATPTYTPPTVTTPTYTPPTVTGPTYTPPTMSTPTYTPPSLSLPSYTSTPVLLGSISNVTAFAQQEVDVSYSYLQQGTYNKLARFDRVAARSLAAACVDNGVAVTNGRHAGGYFEFVVYSKLTPVAVDVNYYSKSSIARVGRYLHRGAPDALVPEFVAWLLKNGWPAEHGGAQEISRPASR